MATPRTRAARATAPAIARPMVCSLATAMAAAQMTGIQANWMAPSRPRRWVRRFVEVDMIGSVDDSSLSMDGIDPDRGHGSNTSFVTVETFQVSRFAIPLTPAQMVAVNRFARRVFLLAGIYGLVVLLPQYALVDRIGRDTPPPITHVEYFYGFVGVAIAWQLCFLAVARDPVRLRAVMLPAVVEKLAFGVPVVL